MATKHYVDNALFLTSLRTWQDARERALRDGEEMPRIPEYVGECFMAIAKHLSSKPNFCSYSFREDMVSEAVENCVIYASNFDPTKSENPFGYFTQIVYYAFIRKIQKERKQTYIRYKMLEQIVINGGACTPGVDGSVTPTDPTSLNFDNVQEFISKFDKYTAGKRVKRSNKTPRLT